MLTNEQGDEDSDSDSAEDFSTSSNNMTNSMLMTNSALMTNSVIEMASAFEKGQISSGSAFEGSNLNSQLQCQHLKANSLQPYHPHL